MDFFFAVFLASDIFQRYDTNILSGKKNVKTSKTKSGKKLHNDFAQYNDFDEVPVMKSQRPRRSCLPSCQKA